MESIKERESKAMILLKNSDEIFILNGFHKSKDTGVKCVF